jgi:23S rRNA (pseudouridine1915-N3)-methyltransferase
VVALDVGGQAMTSHGFARWLEARLRQGKGNIAFVIGGADGLPQPIRGRADQTLSLSTMTLPHRLARLFLAEQLYRAVTILRNEPYAR